MFWTFPCSRYDVELWTSQSFVNTARVFQINEQLLRKQAWFIECSYLSNKLISLMHESVLNITLCFVHILPPNSHINFAVEFANQFCSSFGSREGYLDSSLASWGKL